MPKSIRFTLWIRKRQVSSFFHFYQFYCILQLILLFCGKIPPAISLIPTIFQNNSASRTKNCHSICTQLFHPMYLFNRQGWYVTLANLTFLSIFLSKFKGQIRDYNLTFCACCMMMLVPRENRPPLYIVVDESGCRVVSSKHTKLIILCTLDPKNYFSTASL